MNFRKTLAAMAIGMLMAAGLSTPAEAAQSACYDYPGTVCLTAHANWGTPVWRQYPWQIDGCEPLTGFNDITTMARNGSLDGVLVIWQHYDCTGEYYQIGGKSWVDFSGYWWNDKGSAVEYLLV